MFRCILTILLVITCTAISFAREDEEPNPKKPTKKVVVDDDVIGGGHTAPDLVRAAAQATNPVLKKYFQSLSVVCDRVGVDGKSYRVTLLPVVWGKDKYPGEGFGIAPLDETNKTGDALSIQIKDVRGLVHYEAYALLETATLLNGTVPQGLKKTELLTAAERALTAVMFAHESAVETNKRRGKSWEQFKTDLVNKLLDIRLDLVKQAVEAKDWPKVTELVARFSERYRSNEKVMQELLGSRLGEAVELSKSEKMADLERARDALADYESKFPNHNNAAAKQVKAALAEKTKLLLEEVKAEQDRDPMKAKNLLSNIASLDPNNPTLRNMQKELKAGFDILIVGVKRLPRLMSPSTAREDSERLAVELMFEGLLEAMPDVQTGTTFRPVLAAVKPRVGSLSRDVILAGNVEWGKTLGGAFNSTDVIETIRLMKDRRQAFGCEAADWLLPADLYPNEAGRLRINLEKGHPDPRELLTFKVLPGKYLAGKNKLVDDDSGGDSFARNPFGTGPYKLAENYKASEGSDYPKDVVFIPNTNYWRRPGKIGQPSIKEIRFVDSSVLVDPVSELKGDRLQVYFDIPTSLLDRYQTQTKATVVTPTTNRRIHFLAINHNTPALQSVDVRRGLGLAIDRETILNDVFRGGKKEFHKALGGPFPAGTWQERSKDGSSPKPLFNLDLATVKLKSSDSLQRLSLLYPNDDQQAKLACERIAANVAACGKIELAPTPVSPIELRDRVERLGKYELAYMSYDYPDIWNAHALAAMLDPTATGPGGRNFLNYLVKSTNPGKADDSLGLLLQEVRMHRDSQGKLKTLSHEVHERFVEAMPFIPLWQIDRHTAISANLRPYVDGQTEPLPLAQIDPARFFHNVSRWRMEYGK